MFISKCWTETGGHHLISPEGSFKFDVIFNLVIVFVEGTMLKTNSMSTSVFRDILTQTDNRYTDDGTSAPSGVEMRTAQFDRTVNSQLPRHKITALFAWQPHINYATLGNMNMQRTCMYLSTQWFVLHLWIQMLLQFCCICNYIHSNEQPYSNPYLRSKQHEFPSPVSMTTILATAAPNCSAWPKFCIFKPDWGSSDLQHHTQPHMDTAAGPYLLRLLILKTYFIFNYWLKKEGEKYTHADILNMSHRVFKTNQLAKATCAEIVLHTTRRQPLHWLLFVMQCTWDGGLSGRQANENSVGGGRKTESRWDVPRRRQPLPHPSNCNQHPKLTHHNGTS